MVRAFPASGSGCEASPSAAEGASSRSRIPNAAWFCERGDFWGTINQICLCAKCGMSDHKRHDEPRHYGGIFTPQLHMLCDECFGSLPDEEPAATTDDNRLPAEGPETRDKPDKAPQDSAKRPPAAVGAGNDFASAIETEGGNEVPSHSDESATRRGTP
jgi:hypothetical protein